MIAAILNSAMLDSDTTILDWETLLSSLRFTQKHSQFILNLTQTNSIWLKPIHSQSTWWWQSYWILPSWIQPSYFFLSNSLTHAKINFQHLHKKTSLIHSESTWCLQLSWNMPFLIQPFCTKKTSLIHSDSTWWWQPSWILQCWIQTLPSWIQTPCYLLSDSLKKHSHLILTLTQTNSVWFKLIHSDWTWWW